MKTCESCGEEIYTRDGDGKCERCDRKERTSRKTRQYRQERDETLRGLGLIKCRGELGGTYWE